MDDLENLEELLGKAKTSSEFDLAGFDAASLKAVHIRNLGSTFGHAMATVVVYRPCELLYRLSDLAFRHGPAISAIIDALKMVTSNDQFRDVSSKAYAGFLDELDKVINLFAVVTEKRPAQP